MILSGLPAPSTPSWPKYQKMDGFSLYNWDCSNVDEITINSYLSYFQYAESEFSIHFILLSTVCQHSPQQVGQNNKNRTDFRFTVEGVVMGMRIPLKAISHIFSTLNLIFSSISDESQRYAKIHQIPKLIGFSPNCPYGCSGSGNTSKSYFSHF